MKQPLSDRIHYFQGLIAQALEDINSLLAQFPEEEVKEDIFLPGRFLKEVLQKIDYKSFIATG
ncbi:MAG: hypothetical protein AAFP92_18395 [Bacteroidota bacterium]